MVDAAGDREWEEEILEAVETGDLEGDISVVV